MATLAGQLPTAFVQFWENGSPTVAGELAEATAFWQGFHVIKALAAMALLVPTVSLGVNIWQRYAAAASPSRRFWSAALGVAGAPIPVVVLLVAMTNVQGAVAPLSSVLSLLPMDGSDPQVSGAMAAITAQLESGERSAALSVLVQDFVVYHLAFAVVLTIASVGLLAVSALLWVRRARITPSHTRLRRIHALGGVILPIPAACLFLWAVVNYETAADPIGGLLGFYAGGY